MADSQLSALANHAFVEPLPLSGPSQDRTVAEDPLDSGPVPQPPAPPPPPAGLVAPVAHAADASPSTEPSPTPTANSLEPPAPSPSPSPSPSSPPPPQQQQQQTLPSSLMPALADSTTCLSLANSSVCQSWSQGFVNVTSSWSIAAFDTSLSVAVNSPLRTADFNRAFGCSWGGTGIRYGLTYACAERVFSSDADCNPGAKPSAPASARTLMPLCASTCNTYLASLAQVFSNAAVCRQKPSAGSDDQLAAKIAARQQTLSLVQSFCDSLTERDPTQCVASTPLDQDSCGLAQQPASYIRSFCNSSPNEPCCQKAGWLAQAQADPASSASMTSLILTLSTIGVFALFALPLIVWLTVFRPGRARQPRGHMPVKDDDEIPRHNVIFGRHARKESLSSSMLRSRPSSVAMVSLPQGQCHSHLVSQPHGEAISSFGRPLGAGSRHASITRCSSAGFPLPATYFAGIGAGAGAGAAAGGFGEDADEASAHGRNESSNVSGRTTPMQDPNNRLFVAVYGYERRLSDEMDLWAGDEIMVEETFNDGWMRGMNFTTGGSGTFPAACLGIDM
ncbi:hypothetical protein HK105_208765 [Polyrhizophydium stewartii]|uniref:SH3 domain-containing protein n=1 Tax=Polyrhizophydium stewartii TaxID=2732419 RepID=A0ABR4MWW4_9FUNG